MNAVCILTNNKKKINGYILFTEMKNKTKITINISGYQKERWISYS